MLFLKKTDETILRGLQLSTNPPISKQSFHGCLLCPNFKNEMLSIGVVFGINFHLRFTKMTVSVKLIDLHI